MTETAHVVGIVVDPVFGDRVDDLLNRLPVWMADTEIHRAAAAQARRLRASSKQSSSHTEIGAVTTFSIDTNATPETWCIEILDTVAGHHDRYSHSPGYSAVEVYGVAPSPGLLKALAEYRLTNLTSLSGGFRASTPDGQPAASPNDA
jgi:hypothetical protein